jgi:hypothetical protein
LGDDEQGLLRDLGERAPATASPDPPGVGRADREGDAERASVKAGAYRIVVRDRSARHNFRLAGRRVNRTTGADSPVA